MSVVTFWSNGKEQTGKTLSLVAIATLLGIEHNMKTLIVSTSRKDDTLKNCYVPKPKAKSGLGMFAARPAGIDMQNGMSGLVKIARSNKVTSEVIKNYTKVVFSGTLEVLLSGGTDEDSAKYYPDIIAAANQYYDLVLVDLDTKLNDALQREILTNSDLIVANISQRLASLEEFLSQKKENDILNTPKTIILMGRYDKFSKYSAKNVSRHIGVKETDVLAMPYNTLFFEASEEAGVPDLFLRILNIDKEDRNYEFLTQTRRAIESIRYKLQELQMR